MQQVGDIAIGILNYHEAPSNVIKCTDALVKANKVYAAAYGMVLSDELTGISDVWQKDVVPLVGNAFNSLEKDPTVRLEQLYDMYMNDEGYLATYNEFDKSTIILTALSMVGAAVTGGVVGVISAAATTILCATLGITLETFTTYFSYAAHVVLRYGFSGRYADRTSYYLSTIM